MYVTLFSVEGLSAESHTDIQRRLREHIEGSVGAQVPDRTGFGILDETLVTNTVSAVVATAALIIQYRDRRKGIAGAADDDGEREKVRDVAAELAKEEVDALERVLDGDDKTLQCRGLDFHLRISKEVLEVRVTRSKDPKPPADSRQA